jgi:hypothetical protein
VTNFGLIIFRTFSERFSSHSEMLFFYAVTVANKKPCRAPKEHSHAAEILEMGKLDQHPNRHCQSPDPIYLE